MGKWASSGGQSLELKAVGYTSFFYFIAFIFVISLVL